MTQTTANTVIMTLPNLLTGMRVLLCPIMLYLGWQGRADIFIMLLIVSFLLDAIDGPLARWLGQVSELGPRLDSTADFALYVTLAVAAWWLWPAIYQHELFYIGLVLASVVLPPALGLLKFGRLVTYHSWLTKTAVVVTAPAVILLFLSVSAWPFRIAAFICLLAAIENIAVTLLSKTPPADIRTVLDVSEQHYRH